MSISVTVSGQDSISVVSSQPLTDTVEISSISALDPLKTATGSLRNDISINSEDVLKIYQNHKINCFHKIKIVFLFISIL